MMIESIYKDVCFLLKMAIKEQKINFCYTFSK